MSNLKAVALDIVRSDPTIEIGNEIITSVERK